MEKGETFPDLPDLVLACHRLPIKGVTTLEYAIPVNQPGFYDVSLVFAERVPVKQDRRQFDVYIDDQLVLKKYDILQQAGRYYQAVAPTVPVSVLGPSLSIRLAQTSGKRPIISGIVVRRHPLPTTGVLQSTVTFTQGEQDGVARADETLEPTAPDDNSQIISEGTASGSGASLKDNIPFVVGVAGAALIVLIVVALLIAKARTRRAQRRLVV